MSGEQSIAKATARPACAFCGSKKLDMYYLPDSDSRHVYCLVCNGSGPWGNTDAEAETLYNQAVRQDIADARVAKLVKVLRAAASKELPDGSLCWCPMTGGTHSGYCEVARAAGKGRE